MKILNITNLRNRLGSKGRRRWSVIIPALIIIGFITTAVSGSFIAPYPPNEGNLSERLTPPFWIQGGSSSHILGTDMLGRDVLSRILAGAWPSFIISVLAISISGAFGSIYGLVSGNFGRAIDALMMRFVDIVFSIPAILLAFVLAISLGPSLENVILIIALVGWAPYARLCRGEVLSVKERDFVAMAKVVGCSNLRIMLTHIFPNVLNTLVVLATLQVGRVIILEASLSFLGVGLPPPDPSWGLMVSEGRGLISSAWWVALFPGIAMIIVVLSFNLFGDWLRYTLDPKLRQV